MCLNHNKEKPEYIVFKKRDLMFIFFQINFQVAAQNCRKRKMDLISQLEDQVNKARRQKQSLLAEREELYRLRDEWTHKLLDLETEVLRGLNRKVNDYNFDYSGATVAVTRLAKSKA